jgi:hypothetical protein
MANERTDPANFVAGPLSSASLNALPRGAIAQKRRSSDSGNTGTIQAVLATGTLALPAGRRFSVSGLVNIRSDIAGGVQVALHQNGTQIQRINDTAAFANKDICYYIIQEIEPSAGNFVFELMVGVSGSDGNLVQSRADGPAGVDGETVLFVADVGPAYT